MAKQQMTSHLMNRSSLRTLAFALSALFLVGCGGVKCKLASCHPTAEEYQQTHQIKVGDSKLAVKQTHGLIWGGVLWGMLAEDSSIVEVSYVNEGRSDICYLKGLKPGITRVAYINRHSHAEFSDVAEKSFIVEVVE